jgi:hypothetical protein
MKSLSSFLNEAELTKTDSSLPSTNPYSSITEICNEIIKSSKLKSELEIIDWSKTQYEIAPKTAMINLLSTKNEKYNETGRVRLYVTGNVKSDKYKVVLSNEYLSSRVPSSETVLIQGNSSVIRSNIGNVAAVLDLFETSINMEKQIQSLKSSYETFSENLVNKLNTYAKTKFKTLYRDI